MASAIAVAAPASTVGHRTSVDTVRGHKAEDSVAHDPAEERGLARQTVAATAADAQAAEAAVAGNEHEVGSWGPLVDWPVVGVHVALLANGKVLAYDSVGDNATETYPVHDHTRATLWDPATGTQTPVWVNTGFNVFCSGLAHLSDGTLFLAGGNLNSGLDGIVQTHLFNHQTNAWSLGPNMAAGRWYPTVTPLRNGEMLITEGGPDIPEVRTTGGNLRRLSTASLNLPLYPWIDVAPNGRAFYSGPDQTMRGLDTSGTGAWQSFGQRDPIDRSYGGHALFDVGKILVAGGGGSSADARVVNISGATPQVTATAPMANGRRQHNLTVLADGTVLATGGNDSGASLVDLNNGVYAAELWNPATGTWRTLAAEQATRQYHSTALLLPDGRVLSSGGGICGTCDQVGYLAKNGQVFTPPYLYKPDGSGELAPRPTITGAPATIDPATNFQIDTPDAASISKVALVRLGAVTHSVNMEQRYVPLSFTAGAGALTATAPANADIAPPGVYMLFTIDANGVPSIARMVTVSGAAPPPPPPPPNSGLVGAWGFSEGSGGTTADASGNANTGTITGASWTAQGRYGNALSFNGTSNVVRVPSSASLNLTTGMTLSAWIRPAAAQGGWRTILQRQTDAYFLSASNGDPLHPAGGGTFGGSIEFVGGPTANPLNTWTHVALSYDLATLRLYVNGTQVATHAATGSIQTNTNPLWMGGNTPYGEYFQGLIDEARVYNRALTPAEIQTDMNTPVTPAGQDTTPPTAPTGLTATAVSSTQVNLGWTASTDNVGVTEYRVERCAGSGCTNFVQVATPTGTSFNDTGRSPSTTYRYQVRAADAAANLGPYSTIATATTPAAPDTTAPTAPTGLTATAVSSTQVNLGWTASTDNVGVTEYRVERCAGSGCTNFVQVATPTGTSFNDTGRSPSTTYRYQVRAADAAANLGPYSTIATATTPAAPDTTAPTAPTGLTATAVSSTQVNLGWTASTDNVGVTEYRVERCAGSGCTNFVQVATPTGTSFNDTGRSPSTTYRYQVRAADAAANLGPYSTIATATTPAAPDTTAPTAPTGLTATAVSSTQVNLGWTASTDNVGVTEYRVERCAGSGCTNFVQVATPTGTSFNDTGRSPSTTYRYQVRAADAAANLGPYSTIATATTPAAPDTTPPTAPTGLTATAVSSTQVNLGWTASTDNVGVTEYRVERCAGSGCTNFVQVATPTGTSFNDTGRSPSTTYRYQVRAADAAANLGPYSTIATATTPAAPDTTAPTAPTGLTATAVSSTQVNLGWTASTDNVGVTEYRVERCAGSGCTNFVQVATPTGTSFNDTGRSPSTTYRYQVRAADAAANLGPYSTIATATTPAAPDTTAPTAPTGLTATAVSSTQVNLGWTASTDNVGVTEYRVERCAGSGCTNFVQVATPTGTSFNDTGRSPSTTYRYQVRAADAAANVSAYSAVAEATTDAAPPTPLGLVGAWAFGEGAGTTTVDGSGNGNTGTITAGTWSTEGRYGNALSFNGNDSVVRVPSSATLNLTTAMTLSAWIRPASSQPGWRTVLQRQADAYFLAAGSDAPRRPAGGGTLGGGVSYLVGPTANPVSTWTYLAVTYDGSTLRLYVNGTQVGSRAATGAIQTTTNPLWIGGNQPYGEFFRGLIDEVRVYNRALSQADIQTDMNTAIDSSGLLNPPF